MGSHKRVTIYGLDTLPVNTQALKRLIYHYYKGPRDVEVRADRRLLGWGDHICHEGVHHIRISPKYCSYNKSREQWNCKTLTFEGTLAKMNRHDITCRVIQTLLHELRHAHQCDKMGTKTYDATQSIHPDITQCMLKIELSDLESDAEGWALLNFKRALARYMEWAEKYEESD